MNIEYKVTLEYRASAKNHTVSQVYIIYSEDIKTATLVNYNFNTKNKPNKTQPPKCLKANDNHEIVDHMLSSTSNDMQASTLILMPKNEDLDLSFANQVENLHRDFDIHIINNDTIVDCEDSFSIEKALSEKTNTNKLRILNAPENTHIHKYGLIPKLHIVGENKNVSRNYTLTNKLDNNKNEKKNLNLIQKSSNVINEISFTNENDNKTIIRLFKEFTDVMKDLDNDNARYKLASHMLNYHLPKDSQINKVSKNDLSYKFNYENGNALQHVFIYPEDAKNRLLKVNQIASPKGSVKLNIDGTDTAMVIYGLMSNHNIKVINNEHPVTTTILTRSNDNTINVYGTEFKSNESNLEKTIGEKMSTNINEKNNMYYAVTKNLISGYLYFFIIEKDQSIKSLDDVDLLNTDVKTIADFFEHMSKYDANKNRLLLMNENTDQAKFPLLKKAIYFKYNKDMFNDFHSLLKKTNNKSNDRHITNNDIEISAIADRHNKLISVGNKVY